MSTYLIAGASGRVGSVVATELISRQHEVRLLLRNAQRASTLLGCGASAVAGSLADAELMTSALRGADGCFVLLPEDPAAQDFHGGRRQMADAIVTAVRASAVPHVVLLSAAAASLPSGNGPCADLHYLENALRASGTTLTTLRGSWFQENIGMSIAPALQAGIYPNFMPAPDFAFPTIATRDVGRFAAQALHDGPQQSEVVDLLGPVYSIRQLADALGKALGRTLHIVDVPATAQEAMLVQAGLSASFAQAVAELFACFAAGRVRPECDRSLAGATTIEDVLRGMLASVPAMAAHPSTTYN